MRVCRGWWSMSQVETPTGKREIDDLDQCAARQFRPRMHVAEQANALTGHNGIDRMQLVNEGEAVCRDAERDFGVDPARHAQPSLPGRRTRGARRPSMYERVLRQIRRAADQVAGSH